jgi:peptidoglycan hydrolase-like protein with peptidoglycan-binding domain
MHGPCASYLQIDLNQKGNIHVEVNGEFDQKTTDAVKAFQRSRGLPADGVVGPQTWRELGPA